MDRPEQESPGAAGSLQLTPVECDSDEDGVIDELDVCPVDDLDGCV